jgi:hypothetical protein
LGIGLWRIYLRKDKPQLSISAANDMYELLNAGELVNYLHKAMFSPTKSALIKSMKQVNHTTWPGLTEDAINMQVTSDLEDAAVTPAGTGDKTKMVYALVIDQGQLDTDLNGRFPLSSSKGNWYVVVVYSFD